MDSESVFTGPQAVQIEDVGAMIKRMCLLLMLFVTACDKPAATRPATGPASAPTVKRVHVFVRGKVQEVGFRNFTKERADDVGAKGWVKNLEDGRVEAVMQGKADAVQKLLQSVSRGPANARVDGVEVKEEKIAGEFADFRVIEGQ